MNSHTVSSPEPEVEVFRMAANIPGRNRAVFLLTYEELLQRRLGRYEHVTSLRPMQLVSRLSLDVTIVDHAAITDLQVLPLRNGRSTGASNSAAGANAPKTPGLQIHRIILTVVSGVLLLLTACRCCKAQRNHSSFISSCIFKKKHLVTFRSLYLFQGCFPEPVKTQTHFLSLCFRKGRASRHHCDQKRKERLQDHLQPQHRPTGQDHHQRPPGRLCDPLRCAERHGDRRHSGKASSLQRTEPPVRSSLFFLYECQMHKRLSWLTVEVGLKSAGLFYLFSELYVAVFGLSLEANVNERIKNQQHSGDRP